MKEGICYSQTGALWLEQNQTETLTVAAQKAGFLTDLEELILEINYKSCNS